MDYIQYAVDLKKRGRGKRKARVKDPSLLSEAQEGKLLVTWFSRRYFKYQNQLIHIPNGAHFAGDAKQRGMQMNSLKAQGLVIGASDYFLAVPTADFFGLWLELKRSNIKKASDNQIIFLRRQKMFGYEGAVCSGFEAAKIKVDEYLEGIA